MREILRTLGMYLAGLIVTILVVLGPALLLVYVANRWPENGPLAFAIAYLVLGALWDLSSIPSAIPGWDGPEMKQWRKMEKARRLRGTVMWLCGVPLVLLVASRWPVDGPLLFAGFLVIRFAIVGMFSGFRKYSVSRASKRSSAATGPGSTGE